MATNTNHAHTFAHRSVPGIYKASSRYGFVDDEPNLKTAMGLVEAVLLRVFGIAYV